ncbi:MAG: hypothetical protein MZV64_59930 [Ignavibacteriales bacterium]|nr:hypothetical protein [Ignavibacteriales bacterium]
MTIPPATMDIAPTRKARMEGSLIQDRAHGFAPSRDSLLENLQEFIQRHAMDARRPFDRQRFAASMRRE